jgi:putative DNA methylase
MAEENATVDNSPLANLRIEEVNCSARRESRNREVFLPPVSAFRWWARRTAAVNQAVLEQFSNGRRLRVADPFAGGGVIPLLAATMGHDVYAQEINPWAVAGIKSMLSLPPPGALRAAAVELGNTLGPLLDRAYSTCLRNGADANISQTLRVAVAPCTNCGESGALYPHALVSLLSRKERKEVEAFLACPSGHLFAGRRDRVNRCPACDRATYPQARYTTGRLTTCSACNRKEPLAVRMESGGWRWRTVLVERASNKCRELDFPTQEEMRKADQIEWSPSKSLGPIGVGRETQVLRRHGFQHWYHLYPNRQRVVLERLLEACSSGHFEESVARTLRIAALGTAEMAGFLSRWDRWYLKSYESMALHRFNFTTLAAEPNVWGANGVGRGTFIRRVELLERGASWFHDRTSRKVVIGPWPRERGSNTAASGDAYVHVVGGSSEKMELPDQSVDLVLTDPPYHDDVNYDELSMPFQAWADLSMEASGNGSHEVGASASIENYQDVLTGVLKECRRVLVEEGRVTFSYANRNPRAWTALFASLQAAGFRPAGYAIVYSDSDATPFRRSRRSCTLDMILDVVPECAAKRGCVVKAAGTLPDSEQAKFLHIVGRWFAKVGMLTGDWVKRFEKELSSSAFLRN